MAVNKLVNLNHFLIESKLNVSSLHIPFFYLVLGPHKPRYVRVNTLLLPTEEAIQNFQDDEWVLSKFLDKNDYDGFLQKISNLEEGEFTVDIHIPDLLIFPPRTEFHNHPAYQKGSILLQDKVRFNKRHICK